MYVTETRLITLKNVMALFFTRVFEGLIPIHLMRWKILSRQAVEVCSLFVLPFSFFFFSLRSSFLFALPFSLFFLSLCSSSLFVLAFCLFLLSLCSSFLFVLAFSLFFLSICSSSLFLLRSSSLFVLCSCSSYVALYIMLSIVNDLRLNSIISFSR